MTTINATDKILIDYIDTELDKLGIKYRKEWQSKYNSYVVHEYEPFMNDGFIIIYRFDNLKDIRYMNKLANDFISKREHLEKCFNIKSYIRKDWLWYGYYQYYWHI